MDILKMIFATLVGTSMMTAFSYLLSEAFKKLFKEPVLLQYIMRLLHFDIGKIGRWIAGWAIHYFIGFLFILGYEFALRTFDLEFDLIMAMIFGAASGILGIIGWMIIFSLPSDDPKVNYRSYYIQLFIAHIIFALGVWAVYKLYS